MRTYTIAFIALAAVLLYTECISAMEICPQENCLLPDKCSDIVNGPVMCEMQGTTCCSIVKEKYRTHCRHHGGACMDQCNSVLQRDVVDCPNEVCCVLV